MAVSSSTNSTSVSGSALDVAGIVSGLMEAENIPVTKLEAKISSSTVRITALGQIKSQLSSLKTALLDLQNPANFSKPSSTVASTSIATSQANSAATAGIYSLTVTQLAQPTIRNVRGFTSEAAALTWFQTNSSLNSKSSATILKVSSTEFVLSVRKNDDIADSDLTTALTAARIDTSYTSADSDLVMLAQNAVFTLNGVTNFSRTSNAVTDAISGVTINLNALGTTQITVTNDQVSARTKLDALVKSYNSLYSTYKQQTSSSIDSATRGILNSDFSVSAMMRQLTSGLLEPLSDSEGLTLSGQTDLSSLGLKMQDDGTLLLDEILLATASSTLQSRLSTGIRIGYNSSISSDLSSRIGEMLLSGGLIQNRIENEQATQRDLSKRKTDLQQKLVQVQARYTAQYAALDSLLFKLQSTSDSLKSALDGLTNSQKNG